MLRLAMSFVVSTFGLAILTYVFSALLSNQDNHTTRRLSSSRLKVASKESNSPIARDEKDGWKTIHVFYGNEKFLKATIPHDGIWYSQAAQDQIVHALLNGKRNGYFIDLAANDPVYVSNTYALENFGWDGLCFEPNPQYWHRLSFRKCQVIGAMVGSNKMQEVDVAFPSNRPLAGLFGGIVGDDFDNKPESAVVTGKRTTVALQDVFAMFQVPAVIDYLSLDVEGAEEFIMIDFPFNRFRISLLTVERPSDKLKDLLQNNGYIFLEKLTKWGETLWAHESVGLTKEDVDNVIAKGIYVDEKNFVACPALYICAETSTVHGKTLTTQD